MKPAHDSHAIAAGMKPTVLIVPGLRDHVADHWQTLLANRLPKVCTVAPLEHDKLSRAARVAALDAAIARIDGAIVLVAHSAGALTVVHWAQQHRREIAGALLATPADMEQAMPAGYPTREALAAKGWLPIPTAALPFPSLLCASRNDPLARFCRSAQWASAWGSRLVDLGEVGHLNPASGYGDWPMAEQLIAELT